MSHESFSISETNPNDTCGGGGCACSPQKVSDCDGPYAIFQGPETDSHLSPYNVIGFKCLCAAFERVDGEALSAGEPGYVEPSEETVERFTAPAVVRKDPIPRV